MMFSTYDQTKESSGFRSGEEWVRERTVQSRCTPSESKPGSLWTSEPAPSPAATPRVCQRLPDCTRGSTGISLVEHCVTFRHDRRLLSLLGFVHNWPTSRWSATYKEENRFSLNRIGSMSSFLGRQLYRSTLYINLLLALTTDGFLAKLTGVRVGRGIVQQRQT